MMAHQLVSPAINKEIRAIAPGWLACVAALGAVASSTGGLRSLVIPVYVLGSVALGALSIGHEYSSGTLTLFLLQPRRRDHLFLTKMGVLLLLLLILSGVARIALFDTPDGVVPAAFHLGADGWLGPVLLLPLLCGLFLAPALTMLSRNPLAGVVFTLAAIALLVVAGDIAAAGTYGADATALRGAVVWRGMLVMSTIAAIASWRLFTRLEAIDGRGQAVHLPWRRSHAAPVTGAQARASRHPVGLLIRKELRLQQLSFVVGGLYVLGWLGTLLVGSRVPGSQAGLFFALTAIVSVAVSLLAGSLSSAEERQLGTLEWHALLPLPARTQWMVKGGMAVSVAAVLGLGLPALLTALSRSARIRGDVDPLFTIRSGLSVMFLTVMSLYVSSLCTSGLRAVMWSLLSGFVLMVAWMTVWVRGQFRSDPFLFFNYSWWSYFDARMTLLLILLGVVGVVMYGGVVGLLWRFARLNHNSSERGAWRISSQLVRVGGFVALVAALWFGVSQTFVAEMRERNRAAMQKVTGTLWVGAIDSTNTPVRTYTVVVFGDGPEPGAGRTFSFTVDRGAGQIDPARFETHLRPGRYAVVAVETLGGRSERDPELSRRLKARATPLTIAAGDSKTLTLLLATY